MISPEINILTDRDLDAIKANAFQAGVKRGLFEASDTYRNGPYARNCANWKNGICETCGAQHQHCEVGPDFKCPHFTSRA